MPDVLYFGNRFDTFQKAVGPIEKITETEVLPPTASAEIIVIDSKPQRDAAVPIGVIGVVSSDNREGLETLMKSGVRTVTCGMSYRDTVTLSGTVARLTVCLQRRLPTVGGYVREPAEFPIVYRGLDTDCLLLASAVRLLCGKDPN